jgi:hypothetical protein
VAAAGRALYADGVGRNDEGGDGAGVGRERGWIEGFFCLRGDIHVNVFIRGRVL